MLGIEYDLWWLGRSKFLLLGEVFEEYDGVFGVNFLFGFDWKYCLDNSEWRVGSGGFFIIFFYFLFFVFFYLMYFFVVVGKLSCV